MAEKQFIAALAREGQRFDETFLLVEKELRTAANGKMFIRGAFQDKTGQAKIIAWEATERYYEALPRGGFVRAKGRVEIYQNRPQFVVESCVPVEEKGVDLAQFLPSTKNDVAAMEKELREILATIADPTLAAVAKAFLTDEKLMLSFRRSPAAVTLHHAYIGGLMEHSLGLLRLAVHVAPLYPVLNRDLLLLGCFMHDIGKTVELAADREFSYTDSGKLVGHVVLGVLMLNEKIEAVRKGGAEVPEIVVRQLEHLVLAHHGEYEFGSPKLPMTAEAVAVHFLDNMDAKLAAFGQAVRDHPALDEAWTSRQFMFDNQMLYRGSAEERSRRAGPVAERVIEPTEEENGGKRVMKGGLE
jgi:3'-5' exoribonuclease